MESLGFQRQNVSKYFVQCSKLSLLLISEGALNTVRIHISDSRWLWGERLHYQDRLGVRMTVRRDPLWLDLRLFALPLGLSHLCCYVQEIIHMLLI